MRRSPTAIIGLIIAVVSATAMGVAVYELAQKLSARNVDMVRLVGRVTESDSVTYHGQECRVEFLQDESTGHTTALRVHWRGKTIDFPTWMEPGSGELLEKHTGWFGLMILADGAENSNQLKADWSGPDGPHTRLVVAARYPAEGFDPASWGLVRRKDWRYRFVLLDPLAPEDKAIQEWDKSYEQTDAIYLPGKYTKLLHPEYIPATPEARREQLWMYAAMTEVTPPMQFRGRDKGTEGLIASMGWPWPVASAGCVGLVVGIAMWASGRLSRTRIA